MTAEFFPKVTIIIPVYNGADYMAEAIESALSQTYGNLEVIVVNDGSNDGGATEAIARSYGSRIRYFAKANGGVASALNFAIREATGDYISWLSHDDAYFPEKIQCQVDYLREHGEENIVYSDFQYIDSSSQPIADFIVEDIPAEEFLYKFVTIGHVNGCTLMVPRKYFFEAGFFDETLKSTQDYALWFVFAQKYPFRQIREILVKSRVHAGQGSAIIPTHAKEVSDLYIGFVDEIVEKNLLPLSQDQMSAFFLDMAKSFRSRGIFQAAEYAANKSLDFAKTEGIPSLLKVFPGIFYIKYYLHKKRIKKNLKDRLK